MRFEVLGIVKNGGCLLREIETLGVVLGKLRRGGEG